MKRFAFAWALVWLWGCSPATPVETPAPAAHPAAKSEPSAILAETFRDCTWAETKGAGVSMWGYQCEGSRFFADPSLPGITLEVGVAGPEAVRTPIVRLFDIAEGASLSAILPEVRTASPAPGNDECVFVESRNEPGWQEFMPTGELMKKYQLFIESKADAPAQPCGELGPAEGGFRLFARLPGSRSKVAVVYLPSDIAPFDWKTLRAAP